MDKSGAPDVMRYRRIVAQSIHGVPVDEQCDQPDGSPDQDDITDDDDDPEPARLEANCGTGEGGFQPGNFCAKRGGDAGGVGSVDTSRRDAILLKRRRFAAIVQGLEQGTLRNKENGDLITRDNRLTLIEQAAFVESTHRPAAQKLNRFLRVGPENFGKAMIRSQSARVDVLNAAMEKLPTDSGQTWRGMPSQYVARLRVGNSYSDSAYFSTTAHGKHETMKKVPGQAVIRMIGRNGRQIAHTSHWPGEQEVLFKPGTGFQVTSRRTSKSGTLHLTMRETSWHLTPNGTTRSSSTPCLPSCAPPTMRKLANWPNSGNGKRKKTGWENPTSF